MSKRSPRLLFTQEERTAPELKKAVKKADKAYQKLEKAEAKIPKKTIKKKQRVVDPKTGRVTTRLSLEEKLLPPEPKSIRRCPTVPRTSSCFSSE